MKSRLFLTLLTSCSLSFLAQHAVFAQEDGGIKVTTTLHADGTRTDLQKDLTAGTAEEKTYDSGGKLLNRTISKLDDRGQLSEGTTYSAKGAVLFQFSYTRNGLGQISEELDSSAEGKLLRRLVYHYDSTGHVSGIDAFDGQGNPLRSTNSSAKSKKGKTSAKQR